MPNIDEGARMWELDMSKRVGEAVARRRKALGLTAQKLEELTRELGYPITRVAISKIETNRRSAKFDVAEILILAAALDIPPILLLYPGFPDKAVEVVPGVERASRYAALWFAGAEPGPSADAHASDATVLMTVAVGDLEQQKRELMYFQARAGESPEFAEEIARRRKEVELAQRHLELVKSNVWGGDGA